MGKHITMETWPRELSFDRFAEPGDTVDAEIAMNFLNSVPPVSFSYGYFQSGGACYDAFDPKTNRTRPTYSTFGQKGDLDGYYEEGKPWTYLGCCFKGETEPIPFSIGPGNWSLCK